MKIDVIERDAVRLVRLDGRLDAATAAEVERRLGEVLESGATRIALDCAALEYISSAGLRVLLSATKRLRQAQGTLVLGGPPPAVLEILEIAGFTGLLQVLGTAEEAVAACAR